MQHDKGQIGFDNLVNVLPVELEKQKSHKTPEINQSHVWFCSIHDHLYNPCTSSFDRLFAKLYVTKKFNYDRFFEPFYMNFRLLRKSVMR